VTDRVTTDKPTEEIGLAELLSPCAERAEADLQRWLIEPDTPAALGEAMQYCVLGGGKRLRPALVYLSAEAVGGPADADAVGRAAVAVEAVHCYSLVHDDLPAMDDDTLRRGRPTAHVKFGEAMALLVGDALLTRAFGLLADAPAGLAGPLAVELARGAGPAGMIAGQAADMDLCDVPEGPAGVQFIHLRKTAALIRAATRMGAVAGGAAPETVDALGRYGESLGLAFQLVDDLLDVTADAEQLGKTPGKDARDGKRTHADELGLQRTADLGRQHTQEALDALGPLGPAGRTLSRLAELLTDRTH
jgi:geranylgeranyl pyrophosphate synthase